MCVLQGTLPQVCEGAAKGSEPLGAHSSHPHTALPKYWPSPQTLTSGPARLNEPLMSLGPVLTDTVWTFCLR